MPCSFKSLVAVALLSLGFVAPAFAGVPTTVFADEFGTAT
jgi:hypothetical protein